MSKRTSSRLDSLKALQQVGANLMNAIPAGTQWDQDIAKVKKNDKTFTSLDWEYVGVDSTGIANLAHAIRENTSLTSVSVSGNNLPDSDIIILCKAIHKNKKLPLETLNLSFNQVTKESASILQKLVLQRDLDVLLFGNDIEKEVDMSSGLRQTKRESSRRTKTKRRHSTKRKISATKPDTPVKRSKTETSFDKDYHGEEEDFTELEEQVKEMEFSEQEYILRINELEGKIIALMKSKTDSSSSLKSSTSLFSKFKRSLTLEKQHVVITRKLAEIGGSGAGVYSCLVDGWKCAMKELDTTHMTQNTIDGFLGEIQLLEMLPQHNNISRYLFHEISGKRVRLFMTQYHGSLGSYIQNRGGKPFSAQDIWKMALDMIKGIEFLHSNGIIHRDLKSDNIFILLDERNEVLKCAIGDFDTAKQVNSKSEQAKTVLGTPAWMAPEVMDAKELGAYSYSCDVYSFGMILYELLTLKMPYSGVNPMRIPMMVLQGNKPEEPKVDPSLEAIKELYESCIEFKPRKRPSVKSLKSKIANRLAE